MPRASGKRHEVGAQRVRFGEMVRERVRGGVGAGERTVGDDRPPGTCAQGEGDARLEVGLVKAGEELVGVGRDKQRVEVLVAVRAVGGSNDRGAGGGHVGDEATETVLRPAFSVRAGSRRWAPLKAGRSIGCPFTSTAPSRRPRKSRMTSRLPRRVKVTVTPDRAVTRGDVERQVVPDV